MLMMAMTMMGENDSSGAKVSLITLLPPFSNRHCRHKPISGICPWPSATNPTFPDHRHSGGGASHHPINSSCPTLDEIDGMTSCKEIHSLNNINNRYYRHWFLLWSPLIAVGRTSRLTSISFRTLRSVVVNNIMWLGLGGSETSTRTIKFYYLGICIDRRHQSVSSVVGDYW